MYGAERVRRGLDRLEALWAERHAADDDGVWHALRARMCGESDAPLPAVRPLPLASRVGRMVDLLAATGFAFGRSAPGSIPEGAVYLNVGQILLAVPWLFHWLKRRRDVAAVFMLHDVIPLETPQYVSLASARHHATMVATAARHADGLIVTTEHARATVTTALSRHGTTELPTLVRGLPTAPVFCGDALPAADLDGIRYFVICGTIEPRKNHLLLHAVWMRLLQRLGDAAPHLVIVGSPGWRSGDILDRLAGCVATCRHVHPVSGLSSPALKRLLAGARGLLMPSHNEGFGLPILEARQLGVPVVASSIPAHREVVDASAVLLAPDDVAGWEAAILALSQGERPSVAAAAVAPKDTSDYAADVYAFLEACAHRRAVSIGRSGRSLPAHGHDTMDPSESAPGHVSAIQNP
ncbi:MAG: glycosyltransferase [Ancalomicrobiaceae bacterium]|nr:glycosyltransferase [Ancalomicrobiaceae bacterium]